MLENSAIFYVYTSDYKGCGYANSGKVTSHNSGKRAGPEKGVYAMKDIFLT